MQKGVKIFVGVLIAVVILAVAYYNGPEQVRLAAPTLKDGLDCSNPEGCGTGGFEVDTSGGGGGNGNCPSNYGDCSTSQRGTYKCVEDFGPPGGAKDACRFKCQGTGTNIRWNLWNRCSQNLCSSNECG